MIVAPSVVQAGAGFPAPCRARRSRMAGPGDDDETPIGDPPDDDEGDDWDDEDEDDEEDDEDSLQAQRYCGAASPRTMHRGTMASD